MNNIAILGAGLMGSPIAKTLHNSACNVSVYNRTAEKLLALNDAGISTFSCPNKAIRNADFIITMLSDFFALNSVLFEKIGNNNLNNKTIIQMGTISPSQSRELLIKTNQLGATYVECPVLGSIPEAKDGKLILMAGCTQQEFRNINSLLKLLGPSPEYIGEVGSAAAVKLAMNHLIGALTSSFATSLAYIQNNSVNIDKFMAVVRSSALYAKTYDKKLDRMLDCNFENPNFPTKHLLKDLNLFIDSLNECSIDPSSAQGVTAIVQKTIDMGLSNTDYSALYKAIVNEVNNP